MMRRIDWWDRECRRGLLSSLLLCLVLSTVCKADSHVSVMNDGPAVVGSAIMFTANVTFHDELPPRKLIYEWFDNADPPNTNMSDPTNATCATMLITFSGVAQVGFHLMNVKVWEPRTILPDRLLGEWSTLYSVTVSLNGEIRLTQPGQSRRSLNHVLPNNSTQVLMSLHDPHGFLLEASSIDYFWSLNGIKNLGPYNQPQFAHNFTELGENKLHCAVVAHFQRNNTLVADNFKWGMFTLNFNVDNPITYVHVVGDTWLRNGALLNLTMSCNGTSPWRFCVDIKHGPYNITGNETCYSVITSDVCQYQYYRYLANNSSYTAVFIVSNPVSKRISKVDINVTVLPVPQLSYYIVPLSCALLAFIFILFGSIKLIKSRRDYNVEIADFDFDTSDDDDIGAGEVTFWRRVYMSVMPNWRRHRGNDASRVLTDSDPILARGRTHRRSYGIVEAYADDD